MTPRTGTPKRRGPRAGGRPKIDWHAAYAFFASDPTLGYGDVSETYQVSEGAVRKHAKADNWEARRGALIAKAAERGEARALRTLEERQADTIRVAELLRRRILAIDDPANPDAINALALEDAIRHLPAYSKLEQLYAGRPTEITIGEVQELIFVHHQAFLEALPGVLERYVANGKRSALAKELDVVFVRALPMPSGATE